MRARRARDVTRKELAVAVGAGAAGLVNAAGLMVLLTPELLGLNAFWEPFVTTGLLGALCFPVVAVKLANPVAAAVIAVTSRQRDAARVVGVLVREFGLAAITTPLGIGFALVLWLLFGALLIPFVLIAVDRGGPFTFPHLNLDLLIDYVVYGLSLGGFYGLLAQEQDLLARLKAAVVPRGGTR